MDPADFEALQTRLTQVERRLRISYAAWLVSLIVVGVLAIAVPQAASQGDILRARGLEISDASGAVRITVGVLPDGTSEVVLAEAGGRGRMWLHVRPDGTPAVILADAAGMGRIWLHAYPDRSSGLLLSDVTGKSRIWLGGLSNGSTGLVLVDPFGKVLFQAP